MSASSAQRLSIVARRIERSHWTLALSSMLERREPAEIPVRSCLRLHGR